MFATIKNKLLPTLTVCGLLFGGIAWLTTIHADTRENTKDIVRIEAKQDANLQLLIGLGQQMSELKGELKRKPNREEEY